MIGSPSPVGDAVDRVVDTQPRPCNGLLATQTARMGRHGQWL